MLRTLSCCALVALSLPAIAQEKAHAFVGARLLPITAAPIDDGVLIVRGGRIESIGARAQLAIPSNAVVIDCAGKVIMPGLVDTHSHIGGGGARTTARRSSPACACSTP
jgi:imidazolonepropionase-like amidohydrolase